jgi:hypothetical protein
MASNDPTDTGGMFIGRRPGTGPLRRREAQTAGPTRERADRVLSWLLLAAQLVLCLSLFGPQPAGWLWVGSQVQYLTGFVTAGIAAIMIGVVASLMITLALAKRLDHAWKLVRRAAGHHQERGALERIFVIAAGIAVVCFSVWFLVIAGPGPTLAPTN